MRENVSYPCKTTDMIYWGDMVTAHKHK